MTKLERLNQRVIELTAKRDAALRELRSKCKHTQLMESNGGGRPWRICVDCGAEEEGWYCGYHVLILTEEYLAPRLRGKAPGGALVGTTSNWTRYRKEGPLYRVGQSHPNFAGGGFKTYEQLTAQ